MEADELFSSDALSGAASSSRTFSLVLPPRLDSSSAVSAGQDCDGDLVVQRRPRKLDLLSLAHAPFSQLNNVGLQVSDLALRELHCEQALFT